MEQIGQFIIHHWELWLALVAILIAIFINEFLAQKKRAKELSPAEVVLLMNHNEAIVLDLRDPELFRSGHIVGSIRTNPEDFSQPRMEKYKSKPFILVCARGLQSGPLATKLREQGFQQPMVLAGGIQAWLSAELPLVKGKN